MVLFCLLLTIIEMKSGFLSLHNKHPKPQWAETRAILFFFLKCWVD